MEAIAASKESEKQGSDVVAGTRQLITRFSVNEQECIVVTLPDDDTLEGFERGSLKDGEYLPVGHLCLAGRDYLILTLRAAGAGPACQPTHSVAEILTKRELQVALLVAKGRVNKQIAHQLHLSEWTVSTHLRRIYAKLKVRSRAQMVASIMRGTFL